MENIKIYKSGLINKLNAENKRINSYNVFLYGIRVYVANKRNNFE